MSWSPPKCKDGYCGDDTCNCGHRDTKFEVCTETVKAQMGYYARRWGREALQNAIEELTNDAG